MNKSCIEILRIYKEKLKYFNYSERTIEMYCHYLNKFLNSTNKHKNHLIK